MQAYIARFSKCRQTGTRRVIFVVGIIASILLGFRSFSLPSRIALSPLYPTFEILHEVTRYPRKGISNSFVTDSWDYREPSLILKEAENAEVSDMTGEADREIRIKEMHGGSERNIDSKDDMDLGEDRHLDTSFSFQLSDGTLLKKISDQLNVSIANEKMLNPKHMFPLEKTFEPIGFLASMSDNVSTLAPTMQTMELNNHSLSVPLPCAPAVSCVNVQVQEILKENSSNVASVNVAPIISSSIKIKEKNVIPSDHQGAESFFKTEASASQKSGSALTDINPAGHRLVRQKNKMPRISILEMNRLLHRNHASNHSVRPRHYSVRDKQILAAKSQLANSPIVKNDGELYAPTFRNISIFKRSYELMEQTLKVYVYKEGRRPIFHQPLLKGIYASEGWFMKLMETNKHYVVKDPRKAHLFYMPFSSRLLQFSLYVPNSHDQRNLVQYLKNYVDTIAAKYHFWNRTGGADHILSACHDWAPYETREAMKNSIRALCNTDITEGFQLGKDVSLPEIYIRSAQNPQRDLGGMPANERPILAFFAGNVHGSLRPILLEHWKNKDPDMKIMGPMLPGVERKMIYVHHMKTSKYCICPRGYEVNSPRVVESIYYECIPVIISDNFVPPLFEVLNWEAFSVILLEADVPRLKEILMSIPEEKYLSLQNGVRKVQQHFMWHHTPVKYDLFHMILHSMWFNRMHQI